MTKKINNPSNYTIGIVGSLISCASLYTKLTFNSLHLQERKKAQVVDLVLYLGEVNWATIIVNFWISIPTYNIRWYSKYFPCVITFFFHKYLLLSTTQNKSSTTKDNCTWLHIVKFHIFDLNGPIPWVITMTCFGNSTSFWRIVSW